MSRFRTQFSEYSAMDYGIGDFGVSKTLQSEKNLYNPNFIIKQYWRTGDEGLFMKRKGFYADISGLDSMSSFMDVMQHMDSLNGLFMTLSSADRASFNHDPMLFLDFANNPANLKWLADKGIIEPLKDNGAVSAPKLEPEPNTGSVSSPAKETGSLEKSGV